MIKLISILTTNPDTTLLTSPGRRIPPSFSPPEEQVVERVLWVLNLEWCRPDVIEWLRLQLRSDADLSWAKLFVPKIELAIEVATTADMLSAEPVRVINRALDAWRLMVEIAQDERARPPGFIYRPR